MGPINLQPQSSSHDAIIKRPHMLGSWDESARSTVGSWGVVLKLQGQQWVAGELC